jgi:hypothetical protein
VRAAGGVFLFYQSIMRKLGPSRAITQKAFRRGYARAARDVVVGIAPLVTPQTLAELRDWRRRVELWLDRVSSATDESLEFEPCPKLILTGPAID